MEYNYPEVVASRERNRKWIAQHPEITAALRILQAAIYADVPESARETLTHAYRHIANEVN